MYDVRIPSGDARDATVLLVHGGFWRPKYNRLHTGPQATALAADGFHVASVEYRRIPGDWAAMAADIRAGVAAVRADPELPDRVVLLGHSAGGHLVAWALHQPEAAGIAGAISLAGAVDLHLTRDLHLGDGAADAMMGNADESVWRAADPALLGPTPAPVRLIHGTADETVPVEVSESYQAAAGPGIPLTVLTGAGHQDLIDPDSPHFAAALRDLSDLTS
nr:alpha/beta hydrolase [Flexivirga meconopsidis]